MGQPSHSVRQLSLNKMMYRGNITLAIAIATEFHFISYCACRELLEGNRLTDENNNELGYSKVGC